MISRDIVIIGAGPAGASAAYHLKKRGYSVCLIDAAKFPRDKLCGGLITEKSVRLLNEWGFNDFHDLVCQEVRDVNILNNGETVLSVKPRCPFNIVRRYDFDNWLLQKYIDIGGEAMLGVRVKKVDTQKEFIITDINTIYYQYLICADGCHGLGSRIIGNPDYKYALAIESTVQAATQSSIDLDVGFAQNGYAWRFPRGDETLYGFAFSYRKDFDYRKCAVRQFPDNAEYRGAYLPYLGKPSKVAKGRVMVIGDAAGFVDAITGEGTYYAMKSGQIIAEAFDSSNPVEAYQKNVRWICENVWNSAKLIKKFYANRKLILKEAVKHPDFVAYACDYLVSLKVSDYNILKLFWEYKKNKNDSHHQVFSKS